MVITFNEVLDDSRVIGAEDDERAVGRRVEGPAHEELAAFPGLVGQLQVLGPERGPALDDVLDVVVEEGVVRPNLHSRRAPRPGYSFTFRRRNALVITDTLLKLMAALASIGDSRSPKAGYRMPAATGTPIEL